MTSHTTHVFWVKNDSALISAWETALGTIGTIGTVADVDTDSVSTVSEDGEDELGA